MHFGTGAFRAPSCAMTASLAPGAPGPGALYVGRWVRGLLRDAERQTRNASADHQARSLGQGERAAVTAERGALSPLRFCCAWCCRGTLHWALDSAVTRCERAVSLRVATVYTHCIAMHTLHSQGLRKTQQPHQVLAGRGWRGAPRARVLWTPTAAGPASQLPGAPPRARGTYQKVVESVAHGDLRGAPPRGLTRTHASHMRSPAARNMPARQPHRAAATTRTAAQVLKNKGKRWAAPWSRCSSPEWRLRSFGAWRPRRCCCRPRLCRPRTLL